LVVLFVVLLHPIHIHLLTLYNRVRFSHRRVLLLPDRGRARRLLSGHHIKPFLSGYPISRLISAPILHDQTELHVLHWVLCLVMKFVLKVEPTGHVASDLVVGRSGDERFRVLGIGDYCSAARKKELGSSARKKESEEGGGRRNGPAVADLMSSIRLFFLDWKVSLSISKVWFPLYSTERCTFDSADVHEGKKTAEVQTYLCDSLVVRLVPNPDLEVVSLAFLPSPRAYMLCCILPVSKTVERETFNEQELLIGSPGFGEDGVGVLFLMRMRAMRACRGRSAMPLSSQLTRER
jgi:hypothetical protein